MMRGARDDIQLFYHPNTRQPDLKAGGRLSVDAFIAMDANDGFSPPPLPNTFSMGWRYIEVDEMLRGSHATGLERLAWLGPRRDGGRLRGPRL